MQGEEVMGPLFNRRRMIQAGAALAGVSALPAIGQEAKGSLRIIVPLPAGGVADASVRMFAEQWTLLTKQNVVVDNRPGGSFQIGMQQVVNAPADGNTWIHLSSGMPAAQATFKRYDLTKQLVPIGMMGTTPGALFVPASSPIQTAKEMMEWVRANPGKANYGATPGSIEHLSIMNLFKRQGLSGTMVAFKGGPDAMTALAQNELHFVLSALPLIVPFKGKIKPVAIWTDQRAALTPDVPSFREQGFTDIPELNYWGAFAVPAATPAAVIASHQKVMAEILKNPTLVSKYATQGMFARSSTSEVMARIIADDLKWMTPLAAELNLKDG